MGFQVGSHAEAKALVRNPVPSKSLHLWDVSICLSSLLSCCSRNLSTNETEARQRAAHLHFTPTFIPQAMEGPLILASWASIAGSWKLNCVSRGNEGSLISTLDHRLSLRPTCRDELDRISDIQGKNKYCCSRSLLL